MRPISREQRRSTSSGAAYLIVYLASESVDGPWDDIGNDPDFRNEPFTWGICRTNVRGWARPGDDVFFIAKRSGDTRDSGYYLRGRIRIAERVGHEQARIRFGMRQNVILDELDNASTLRSRVAEYIHRWRGQLQWDDGHPDISRLDSGTWDPIEFAVEVTPDRWYVHSYWDPHVDWRSRLRTPYLIADPKSSRVLAQPMRWQDVSTLGHYLPRVTELANKSNRHAARRVRDAFDIELLSAIVAAENG